MEGRRKMAIRCMAIAIVTVVLTGCSDKIIYPDGWIIPKEVETGNLEEKMCIRDRLCSGSLSDESRSRRSPAAARTE